MRGLEIDQYFLYRYQAIQEVVIEGRNEITVSSSSTRTVVSNGDTGLNSVSSLEAHQNAINLSQESLKKKVYNFFLQEKIIELKFFWKC